ncbi:MAG: Fe-S cluster assembly protein SufD [Alphaproteobacteria bacterium]|nr:Fe-S cluster assembly protein SufD [Alphaproteobacteria bacterium]
MAQDQNMDFSLAGPFDEAAPRLPGADLAWLDALRSQGIEAFRANGLPNRKVEAWRYTSVSALEKQSFAPLAEPVPLDALPEGAALAIDGARRIVFVNGRLRADLSDLGDLPEGVEASSLAEALGGKDGDLEELIAPASKERDGALAALNDAFMEDGLVLRIAAGASVDAPIHLISVGMPVEGQAVAFHPRNLVVAAKGSRATLIESHIGVGEGSYFSNSVTDIRVEKGATLTHAKLQDEGPKAFHVALGRVRIGDEAVYDNFVLHRGAELARNEVHARIDGTGAECRLNGAYLGADRQHIDNTTVIEHKAPGSRSSEVFKGALDGRARGVFQGRIVVHRDAQQTDGHQLNKTLLLDRNAEMDAKPELVIYADDVKCSHGATIGELDETALFYLRTRGIDEAAARDILVSAFLNEAVEELRDPALADAFRARIEGWVDARHKSEGERAG